MRLDSITVLVAVMAFKSPRAFVVISIVGVKKVISFISINRLSINRNIPFQILLKTCD